MEGQRSYGRSVWRWLSDDHFNTYWKSSSCTGSVSWNLGRTGCTHVQSVLHGLETKNTTMRVLFVDSNSTVLVIPCVSLYHPCLCVVLHRGFTAEGRIRSKSTHDASLWKRVVCPSGRDTTDDWRASERRERTGVEVRGSVSQKREGRKGLDVVLSILLRRLVEEGCR